MFSQQHNVTLPLQHEIIPAESPVVAPHAKWTTMHHNQKRILASLVEIGWQRDHIVYALTGFAREPEMTQRLPIDLCYLIGIEQRKRPLGIGFRIEPKEFGWIDCAFPGGNQYC